jgi:hypothetical protein
MSFNIAVVSPSTMAVMGTAGSIIPNIIRVHAPDCEFILALPLCFSQPALFLLSDFACLPIVSHIPRAFPYSFETWGSPA